MIWTFVIKNHRYTMYRLDTLYFKLHPHYLLAIYKFFLPIIMSDISLIWQPHPKKLELLLNPPLPYSWTTWSHKPRSLVILAPSRIIDLGSGQTGSAVPSMSTSKHHLVPKIYLYILYTTDI
jgi:hypothetical protein